MAEHSAYSLELSLCFDDVLMSPRFSTIQSRKDVNLGINIGTNGRNLFLKTPLISSPMDTVSMSLMCIKMAMNGGIGILHRYQSIESQVAELKKVKRYLQYIIGNPYTLAATDCMRIQPCMTMHMHACMITYQACLQDTGCAASPHGDKKNNPYVDNFK